MMKFFDKEPSFDIVGKIPLFAKGSGGVLAVCVVLLTVVGLNFGIDFSGGYEIQVKFPKAVDEAEVKSHLAPLGLEGLRVQRFGAVEDNEYLVLVREQGSITGKQKTAIRADFVALAGSEDSLINWAMAESGESITVAFATPVTEEQVSAILKKNKLHVKGVTRGDRQDRPEFSIGLVSIADDIETALREGTGLASGEQLVKRVEFVGPQVGAELRNDGIMAIVYALGFILLYIAVRFDLAFAPGAVLALIHDVLITVGVFSALGLEFNLPVIAAILAIVGYSLNDTIVVYDRIRENSLRYRGRTLRDLVNTSLNQTLSRTLLTSVTTMLVVLALLIVGGGIIRDFSIALTIGVLVGTYSSVAIASPTYIFLRERAEKKVTANKGKSSAVAA
jgi:preprotein translocase subunit SecF